MEELILEIQNYLPLNYHDSNNNEYVKYLMEACNETSSSNKDQFALIAFHMLYMSFIFKIVWQSNKMKHGNIKNLLNNHLSKLGNFDNPFDLSVVSEKDSIDLLKCFGFHPNKIFQFKSPVDNRDHCAHASGFIQYSKSDVEKIVIDELQHIQAIQEKSKVLIETIFDNHFSNMFHPEDQNSFFPSGLDSVDVFTNSHLLSTKDFELIKDIQFIFLTVGSSTKEIIYKKVFYLLCLAKYDELIGNEYDSFVNKFSVLLKGIEQQKEILVYDLVENEFAIIWKKLTHNQKGVCLGNE